MKLKKPKFWDYKKTSFWAVLLLPISITYLIILKIIKLSYSFKSYKKPSIPVICVGNIYLGGTGKTPLVREIFNITKSLGKNPAFIKKYYDYLSDEIKMLKNSGQTYQDRKRYKSILLAQSDNYNVAILDDGFQDLTIKPDFSILCFTSKQLIGNGFMIPSGPLREGINSIARADCILINGDKNIDFEKKFVNISKEKKINIFYSNYKIKNIEKFKNRKIVAFSGIGNPANFFDLLKKDNLILKETFSFPDHHNYSKKDFEKITKDNSSMFVTTEKDYYRMNDLQKQICDYVEIELEIEKKDEFKKILKSYL